MNNTPNKPNEANKKLTRLNKSINKMLDCVNFLENMRSNSVVSSISEEELEKVMGYMAQVEKSIEKINKNKSKKTETLYKAVGKNKKFWVKKEVEISNNAQTNGFKTNPIQKASPIEKTAHSFHNEAKERTRSLLFKNEK